MNKCDEWERKCKFCQERNYSKANCDDHNFKPNLKVKYLSNEQEMIKQIGVTQVECKSQSGKSNSES